MRTLSTMAALILAAIAVPASASPEPTPSDNAAISALIEPALKALKAGKSKEAVDAFLGRNPLIASKASEIGYLASQIDSTLGLYGPISDCQLTETRSNGALVQQRLYHCQHKFLATRWIFLAVKVSDGWIPANLSFDDKVISALGE